MSPPVVYQKTNVRFKKQMFVLAPRKCYCLYRLHNTPSAFFLVYLGAVYFFLGKIFVMKMIVLEISHAAACTLVGWGGEETRLFTERIIPHGSDRKKNRVYHGSDHF